MCLAGGGALEGRTWIAHSGCEGVATFLTKPKLTTPTKTNNKPQRHGGEAELTMGASPSCGGAALKHSPVFQTCFDSLREGSEGFYAGVTVPTPSSALGLVGKPVLFTQIVICH